MIAHIDADSFFASVLRRRHPHLRGKPLLALGMGGGCVIAASYEAKAKGVRTGMRLSEARKLAPDAIIKHANFQDSHTASMQIEQVLSEQYSVIEKMSIDEWFIDMYSCMGGMPKNLAAWAKATQHSVSSRTGIPMSLGIAPTKLLAKMASEYRKPGGITIITNAKEREAFLKDRVIEAIPGVGRKRSMHVHSHGWKTAWDFVCADTDTVVRLFGRPGKEMQMELSGTPIHSIQTETGPPKSISRCRSFRKENNRDAILAYLLQHLAYTVHKMRRLHLACCGVNVWLRDDTYIHQRDDMKLPQSLTTEEQLLPYIQRCFSHIYQEGGFYTQTGLCLWELSADGAAQYSLFEEPRKYEENENLQNTIDTIRDKFGRDTITRGQAVLLPKHRRKVNAW